MPDAPPKRSCLGRLARFSAALGFVGAITGGVALGVGLGMYKEHVVDNPGPHLDRNHIRSIIAQESPVYYRDGTTRVGVFFEDEHRQYVPFDELPGPYVMAIVAAEDGYFWRHPGFNPKGIARAMRDNFKAGKVVAGGSTLTQQTAKNLYYRPDRSLQSKWDELVNALRLEAHYDKTEILTFYVNQFHVSGNGRGLGIAARHFFDKDVDELTVVECAFLAGLVKSPAWYDPFLGDEARRERALERANHRTRYVLQRLVSEPVDNLAGPRPNQSIPGSIAAHAERMKQARAVQSEAKRLLDEGFELEFKRGVFRYDSSAVLDEIGNRLREPPFDEVLAQAGIDDPATAGLVVVTTLDPAAQQSATYGLWHHLTEVGTWMETHTAEDFVRTDAKPPAFDPDRVPEPQQFRLGTVKAVREDAEGKKVIDVDLGGHDCTVDRDGVVRVAVAAYRAEKKNRHLKAKGAVVDAFADTFTAGDIVWTSVRTVEEAGVVCDLELRPELQGAAMVVEDGEVRAMVGGNDNRNFNRATALRQMGSTWKPLVYHAALELGWKPQDALDNARGVFPFSTTFYYPRPDHDPQPVVSMAWAGVKSENLASIWLLYHLTDRLDHGQVHELAMKLDMARRPDETLPDYRTRMQKMGVLSTAGRLAQTDFLKARRTVAASRLAHPDDEMGLTSLLYGWNFEAEAKRVARQGPRTRALKERALTNSWQHLRGQVNTCGTQHRRLQRALDANRLPPDEAIADLSVLIDGERIHVACGELPEGYVKPEREVLESVNSALDELFARLPGWAAPANPGLQMAASRLDPVDDLLIEDRLRVKTLVAIDEEMRRLRLSRELADDGPELYGDEVLYWHQDFRVLLALRYVTALAQEYGVRTEIKPVLSMPLGASEITLEESVSIYSGLTTGNTWSFPGVGPGGASWDSPPAPTLLISEIRDVDGRVLYKARGSAQVVAAPHVADMTTDILRNVVQWGTGQRAKWAVRDRALNLPLGGKTGTTNDFRNAAFLGFAPATDGDGVFSVDAGMTIGVYVGYDDNREMRNGRIVLAGSNGALPAWIDTVKGLHAAGLLGDVSSADKPEQGSAWPLQSRGGVIRMPVDPDAGGLIPADADPEALGADEASILVPLPSIHDIDLARVVYDDSRPIRIAPRTEDALQRIERRRRRRLWGRRP